MKRLLPFLCLLLTAIQLIAQPQIAFPGAEGAGKFTSGGRGTIMVPTTVFEVTSLSDDNSVGTLRYALTRSTATVPYRTIVFRVAGTIHLTSKLNVPANTTIAGQTAPGGGICLADYPVSISGSNVIIRYIRIRMGDRFQLKTTPANCGVPVAPFTAACHPTDASGGDDALGALGHKNIIVDHCSVSWSTDEALTIYRGDSLTLQWNIISEPLNYSYHYESPDTDFQQHGYGGIWGAQHASFHHNLIAHCRNRTPRFGGNSTYPAGAIESADFRNNVLYNWGINNIYGGDGGRYNLVNNYYKYGPNTSSGVRSRIVTVDSSVAFGYAKYYLSGNYVDGYPAGNENNWLAARMNTGDAKDTVRGKSTIAYLTEYLPLVTHTAQEAYDTVLKAVGCVAPVRDTLDARIINDVKNRTGKIIDVQGGFAHGTAYAETVNAWPYLATGTAPVDTDHDGMPDTWETANGLNPNDASDRAVVASNGYTNLENYLNSIKGNVPQEEEPEQPTGSAASATWTLATDATATVTGGLTAADQLLGDTLKGTQYNSTFGTVAGWQRAGSTSYLPVGYSAKSYVEYKVTPPAGQTFTAQSFEMNALGGGTGTARMAIYYSLDNFATSFQLGTCTYNGQSFAATRADSVILLNTSTTPLTGQQVATIPFAVVVKHPQSLTVRVYVWISGSGNRYFASKNVTINGVIGSGALPLKLTRFSAGVQSAATTLQWQTSYENNVVRFEIEKSADGILFDKIGVVNAANTNAGNYSFADNTVAKDVSYYRLKIINKDGSFSYSYVVTVNNKLGAKMTIFPNPVTDIITVTHKAASKNASIAIFNMDGKKMINLAVAPSSTQTSFSTGKLVKGHYLLQLVDGTELSTAKFGKQ